MARDKLRSCLGDMQLLYAVRLRLPLGPEISVLRDSGRHCRGLDGDSNGHGCSKT
jgi:hypothetical protein